MSFFLNDDVKVDLVFIKGDTFVMGYNSGDINSRPEHTVILSDFFIGKFEITQKQWFAVMNNNPSYFKGDDLPVDRVSWTFCQAFISRLNKIYKRFSGNRVKGKFTLPTEAEWEFAARGGENFNFSGDSEAHNTGWNSLNSEAKTHSCGLKKPNKFGLYDMSGNVWEWCWDWYDSNYYKYSPFKNPVGPATSYVKSLRGGSWFYKPKYSQVFIRGAERKECSWSDCGFRIVFKINSN